MGGVRENRVDAESRTKIGGERKRKERRCRGAEEVGGGRVNEKRGGLGRVEEVGGKRGRKRKGRWRG